MRRTLLFPGCLALAAFAGACGSRSPLEAPGDPTPSHVSGSTSDAGVHAADATGRSPSPRTVRAASLALGANVSCAIMTDATVRCWGYAGTHELGAVAVSQCGDGVTRAVTPCVPFPTIVPGLSRVVRLAMGDEHACALDSAGTVRCWGSWQGAVVLEPMIAAELPASPRVVDLAARTGTCARREDSSVWCWGRDRYGELGHGTRDGFRGATSVAMGHHFTCARMGNGTVECAGSNDGGQLGNGRRSGEEPHPVPTTVVGLANVEQVDSGDDHSCAVRTDGTVACWGSSRQVFPWGLAPVEGLAGVTQVAAGDGYTCALHIDGTVACWGVNLEGQLGDGTHEFRQHPTPVAGLRDVVQIAARNNHTCALTQSGDVSCWGLNAHGEVGDGTTTDRSAPTRIDL